MSLTLVTGATGFIGRRLVERLVARGDRVACLVRPTSRVEALECQGVERRVGTLDDPQSLADAVRGVETIYHVAGIIRSWSQADFDRVNAEGTIRLAEAASKAPTPPRFVQVSSLAAAGPSPPASPHDESTSLLPESKYGRSKALAEMLLRDYADTMSIAVVRPPVVFGPGDRDGLLLFQSLRRFPIHFVPQMKGLPLSLIAVDDLIDALIAVAERGERLLPRSEGTEDPTGLYYAADPAESSYAEMGRMAGAAMGKRVWVLCRRKYPFLPVAVAGDLWGRLRGEVPLFGMDKLREASASGWVCDPRKIIDGLGWRPGASLAERYQQTHDWYVENGWL